MKILFYSKLVEEFFFLKVHIANVSILVFEFSLEWHNYFYMWIFIHEAGAFFKFDNNSFLQEPGSRPSSEFFLIFVHILVLEIS